MATLCICKFESLCLCQPDSKSHANELRVWLCSSVAFKEAIPPFSLKVQCESLCRCLTVALEATKCRTGEGTPPPGLSHSWIWSRLTFFLASLK
ncbi:hypothetical protein AVEN_163086-1 [Araneus ventricosus]|uniref:Uncharacterized protein n=1 Tax=Araneus ventricosus TaxID=182803 RepID=A0A4Y2I2G5_ARAVE|nr:hypothetical protein AVEN_163086-1 [Araneus ventricosus]